MQVTHSAIIRSAPKEKNQRVKASITMQAAELHHWDSLNS